MPRPASVDEVLAAVASLPADRTCLVGIDGPGAAGKSTLAAQLAARLPRVVVVHVDDFSGPAFAEWNWPRLQAELLAPLAAGRSARYQRWDWDRDAGAEWHEIAPGAIVVIEGVSSTRSELDAPWALTIWVDAPVDVRRSRAIARDGTEAWARWRDDWIPSELAYIARERPHERVDLLVRGTATGPG